MMICLGRVSGVGASVAAVMTIEKARSHIGQSVLYSDGRAEAEDAQPHKGSDHMTPDDPEEAEIEAALAAHDEWVSAGRPGALAHQEVMAELPGRERVRVAQGLEGVGGLR